MPEYKPKLPEGTHSTARPIYNNDFVAETPDKDVSWIDLIVPTSATENPFHIAYDRDTIQEQQLSEDPTLTRDDFKRDNNFNAVQQAKDDGYGDNIHDFRFMGQSKSQADYITNQRHLEQINSDRQIIDGGSFWQQLAAGGVAALADPTSYIPIGTAAKGAGIVNNAVRIGGSAGAIATGRELVLQTQTPRTAEESVLNIGAETLLAGALGSAFGAFSKSTNKSETADRFVKEVESGTVQTPLVYETKRGTQEGANNVKQTNDFVEFKGLLKDDSGNLLPDMPNYETFALTNTKNTYNTSPVFISLFKSNKDSLPTFLSEKVNKNKRLSYDKRVRKAVNDYIDHGNPSDSIKTKRLEAFRQIERQYVFNQYAKAADLVDGFSPEEIAIRAEDRDDLLNMSLYNTTDPDVSVPEVFRLCD